MGVPKLLSTLSPFGDRKPLDNARVIIDGPALAYHIVGLCMADPTLAATRSHPLEQPTYAQLAERTLEWLDALCQRHNIEVQALYFDGYLPVAKRPVRLERSYRTSAQLKDVFGFYQRDNLPPFDVKGPRTGSLLPAPAFAVPAVLGALRSSARYKSVTKVVPGEADTFCAHRARADGHGTILTSDSDLLVQDLGPNAEVVLFRDIDLPRDGASSSKKLVVPTYKMATICQRLGLPVPEYHFLDGNEATCQKRMKTGKGLYGFAFELSMDPHLGTSELVERAKQGLGMARYPKEYAEFVDQFAFPEAIHEALRLYDLDRLDPRVAEVAIQTILESAPERTDNENGIMFFAPPLVDSCTRTNAWEASAPIRTLAFSLLDSMTVAGRSRTQKRKSVHEYSRMASMASRGSELELIEWDDRAGECEKLAGMLRRLQLVVPRSGSGNGHELQLIVLAAYYEIEWSKEHNKHSACLEVLKETPHTGILEQVTWTALHWLAQVQGTLYSLRMLQQVVEFLLAQGQGKDEDQLKSRHEPGHPLSKLAELQEDLKILTPLAEYPILRTMQDLPKRLKDAGALDLLAEFASLPEITFKPAPGPKKKNRNKKRKRAGEAPPRVQSMTNPFAVLEGSE